MMLPEVDNSAMEAVRQANGQTRPAARRERVVDWRTIEPSEIRGDGIPVEELRSYREKIDELLGSAAGQYVLIVGREIILLFPDLEAAARHAEEHFRGRTVLIKKGAATEPVHTTGGVVG